ncbi:hypothetical protein BDZ89DRAFT_1068282 [Hymenopellis radicata]|nr:hypothetical protein BDZ89DRAFT_1068282 [Hymenopellis radicata]
MSRVLPCGKNANWIDDDPDMFSTLCTICADTSAMASDLKPSTAPSGQKYYELAFDVVLLFGLTELKAQIRWMEKVIYDDLADD